MKNEEKQLLIKDLTARLPYGVKCYAYQFKIDGNNCECYGTFVGFINRSFYLSDRISVNGGKTYDEHYLEVKPYLRPMTSMTDKEVNELKMICDDEDLCNECGDVVGTIYGMTVLYGKVEDVYPYNLKIKISPNINYAVLDYLNSHYFDYRGLIEKGLALEAPEGMYKE